MGLAAALAAVLDRSAAALRRFAAPSPSPLGEVSWADPRRLFAPTLFTPYNPSALVSRQGLTIFDRMRQDDAVKAAMALKKHAILAAGFEVVSPEGQPDDWEPTRFVERVLDGLEGTLEDALLEAFQFLDYGYSVTELLYSPLAPTVSREFAGRLALTGLKTRSPHGLLLNADAHGNLQQLQQEQAGGLVALPPAKFFILVHQGEWGNWYGISDLEAAYDAWWIKTNARKWFAMGLERFGVPPLFGLFDATAWGGDTEKLKTLLKNLQAATFGAIPGFVNGQKTFEFWTQPEAGRTVKDVFEGALRLLDQAIARGILVPSLIGATPDEQQGSFARSKVHFDTFLLVVETLQKSITARFNERIIRPLVDLNYTVETYPLFRLLPIRDDLRTEILTQWKALVDGRVVTPQADDEIHIRTMVGFPALTKPAIADTPPPVPLSSLLPGALPEAGPRPDFSTRSTTFSHDVVARERTPAERPVAFAQIVADLNSLEARAREALRANLTTARDGLLARVERALPELAARGLDSVLKLPGATERRRLVRDFLRAGFELGSRQLRREVRGVPFQAEEPAFAPTAALRYLDEKALTIAGVLDDRLLADAKQVLLNALKFGEPPRETLRKLRELFEPFLGDETVLRDDAVIAPFRLETILRTNATDAFNHGRLIEARDPDLAGLVTAMQYSAVIDDRTTDVCRFLDEKLFRVDSDDLSRLSPPRHFNCRSLLVPVTLDIQVNEDDFITPAQVGQGIELSGEGF